MTVETLFWINLVLTALLTVSVITKLFYFWGALRPRTLALILDVDKKTREAKKINTRKPIFTYQDGSYNIPQGKPWIKHGNTRILLYQTNKADPINPLDKQDSRIDADVYHDVLENEKIKALNRSKGLLSGLGWKQILMYGGGAIIGYLILTKMF